MKRQVLTYAHYVYYVYSAIDRLGFFAITNPERATACVIGMDLFIVTLAGYTIGFTHLCVRAMEFVSGLSFAGYRFCEYVVGGLLAFMLTRDVGENNLYEEDSRLFKELPFRWRAMWYVVAYGLLAISLAIYWFVVIKI